MRKLALITMNGLLLLAFGIASASAFTLPSAFAPATRTRSAAITLSEKKEEQKATKSEAIADVTGVYAEFASSKFYEEPPEDDANLTCFMAPDWMAQEADKPGAWVCQDRMDLKKYTDNDAAEDGF